MKTVVLSSNTSWYLYNFRRSTILALSKEGYHVTCLAPEDQYSKKLESELGCTWLPLKMDNQGNNPFKDASLVIQFWRHYRTLNPVVACHFTIKNNVYGTWAARSMGIPAINNISGLGTAFLHRGLVSTIVRILYKTSQRFAHTIFCQNEDDMRQLLDARLVPADRLQLAPGSGVDLKRFSPVKRDTFSSRDFRFLYAGRMLRDKGLLELKQAVEILRKKGHACTLWLSGFADVQNISALSEQQLSEWAREPGVEWLGSTDKMENVYKEVDCIVLPSYREGMPRSLLEAGAMSIPVITTNTPGCNTVVTDGYNGFLCEPRNTDSLAAAMEKMMLTGASQRALMGKNGRTLVEKKYNESLVVSLTLGAINAAAEGSLSLHGNP